MSPDVKLMHLIFWTALMALMAALFSQHVLGMLPCAWCILQRMLFMLVATLAAIGLIGSSHAPWRRGSMVLVTLISIAGLAAAWHQITVAAQLFSCNQTLADRLVSASGLDAALPWLFGIYATCMDAAVSLLGLDFAVWSLLLFAAYVVLGVVAIVLSYRWPRIQG